MRNNKLFFAIFVLVIFVSLPVFAQDVEEEDLPLVGVEMKPSGFQDRVEAEKFMTSVMNLDLQDPSQGVEFVAVADKGERKLTANIRISNIKNYECNSLTKGNGLRTLADILVSNAPNRVRYGSAGRVVQDVKNAYLPQSRSYCTEIVATSETVMYLGNGLLWKGRDSRTFTIKTTRYSNNQLPRVELIQGGTVGELLPYADSFEYPRGGNLNGRTNQILAMMVFRTSVDEKHRIRGGMQLQGVR